jgi:hypothetical protein
MDMQELKAEAALAANEIEIQWDMLDNPKYRADFEATLEKASRFVPELEGLYVKLTSGKSVLEPDTDSPLPYADIEKYTGLVEEELFNGYVLQEILNKYNMINAVITADAGNPE